ncbi:hypothetical protein [Corynebacterium accolens]|uniref:hypothetical protein n=1 Tax=Corynebacterium accolens TaxID=38284 RepID=UPI002670651B|nr:hypothetical protein [Corynebacterium accolens]WKS56825.1 hypothetical protein NLL31_05165 [Corynebacterium accolens]
MMTPKETATATVEKFFELLGCKEEILDDWERRGLINGWVWDYQDRCTISATSFKYSPGTIHVNVYDLKDDAERDDILSVRKTGPELAAKFTQEAINAYEKELGE